ncbi:MAG: pitrilysin family protein [Candidatus Paceibacterota bacterium]
MKPKKYILNNGIRLVVAPMKDNPTVTALVLVEAGSKYEKKEENGISHFLEHMMFKGTLKRPRALDISRELDALGAEYNAFTSQEFTGYYAKANKKHAEKVVDVVADIFQNPTFPEVELNRERGVIIEEINMYEDMPHRMVHDVFMELLYGDQPAGWGIAGTKEVIKSVKPEQFRNYHTAHYVPEATTVVIAGAITTGDAKKLAEKYFGEMKKAKKSPKKKVKESQKAPQIKIREKKTDQMHLVLGVRTFSMTHMDDVVLSVLSGVLSGGMSSRLFQKMREELGVCYYVRATNDAYTDHGVLTISAGIDKSRLHEVIEVLLSELKRLTVEKVDESELKKVKEYLIGTYLLRMETSDAVGQSFGFEECLKHSVKGVAETIAEVKAVTGEDIKRVAKKIMKNDRLNLAIIGSGVDEKAIKKILTF